jgi:integrase
LGVRGVQIRSESIRIRFVHNGQLIQKRLVVNDKPLAPTPANIKYAERLLAEIKDKIRFCTFNMAEYFGDHIENNSAPSITLVAFMQYWLEAQRIEESTRVGYITAINFWKKSLNATPLASLKHSDILRVAAKCKDLSGKTLNNYISILRQSLALAMRDGLISKNPADGVPKYKYQTPLVDPFSREESDRIIEEIRLRYPAQVSNMVEFWFWTGLRTSEVFGLRWSDVDLFSKTMVISQAKVRGKLKANTKTNISRTVHLNSRAYAALNRQREHTQLQSGAVWADPRFTREWSDEGLFRKCFWTPTLKRLGIHYRRPYNMRHSYATAMLMAGMTPAFCARQLGHSIEMFLRTYARWIDGAQNAAEMDRLEVALGPKTVHELSTEISVTRNDLISKEKTWGDRWDSNPRRPESQSGTLPTELRSPLNCCCSAPRPQGWPAGRESNPRPTA